MLLTNLEWTSRVHRGQQEPGPSSRPGTASLGLLISRTLIGIRTICDQTIWRPRCALKRMYDHMITRAHQIHAVVRRGTPCLCAVLSLCCAVAVLCCGDFHDRLRLSRSCRRRSWRHFDDRSRPVLAMMWISFRQCWLRVSWRAGA